MAFLYGASGHGKVIKDIIESQGRTIDGFLDDNPEINVLSGLIVKHSVECVDDIIISIGNNKTRKKIVEKLRCGFSKAAIHNNAILSPTAMVGEGSVVMAGAIINADAKIGKHCIINTGASIDHECKIGDFVHISPHATLCGEVIVGEGTWIGAGTTVIQGIKIGKWSQIGAGSVVVKDIPDGCVAYGNPCKIVKRINEDML
jgi:sugar O-acyltransferase (sialic acid O-acetyltransferase NeuD family)